MNNPTHPSKLFALLLSLVAVMLLATPIKRWDNGAGNRAPNPGLDQVSSRIGLSTFARAAPDVAARARVSDAFGKLPLSFEANEGQTDSRVKFISRSAGQTLFLTSSEAVFTFSGEAAVTHSEQPFLSTDPNVDQLSSINRVSILESKAEAKPSVLRMKLVGANTAAKVTGLDELPGKSNYFIGNDPKKWRVNVTNYAKVKYEQVYPGVDLVYYGNRRQLEYDLIVSPGCDPARIRVAFDGAEKMCLDGSGGLVLTTASAEMRQPKPVAYQEVNGAREEISAQYVAKGTNEVGFEVGRYDASRPLLIDPILTYSTYLGGSNGDEGNGIAIDSAGNAYITGLTNSFDFPTVNPLQPNPNLSGCCIGDAFVSKLNPSGTALIYSTYIGGGSRDQGNAIAVDSFGNAHIIGTTESVDFPIANALQPNRRGTSDAFVVKLTSTGSAFIYSTYLGGSSSETGFGIAVDTSGNAFVNGTTFSPDFPTANALQPNRAGLFPDSFVAKINPSGTSFVYSTYLGGTGSENGRGIAVDVAGNAYVTGITTSTDFPLVNPVQAEYKGRTIFKSIDGSGNWTPINNGVPAQVNVNTIAVDPSAPSRIYAGTSFGAFKSIDGGASWSAFNIGLFTSSVNQLLVHPAATSTLYGALNSIAFKSTDAGMSWNLILFTSGAVTRIAVDPSSLSIVYAASGQQFYKSTDGGSSWRSVTVRDIFPNGDLAGSLQSIAVDPTTPSTVYVGDTIGVFKSTDGGNTWRGRLHGIAHDGIAIDTVNTSTLYGWDRFDGIDKSTDGGQTWRIINSGLTTKFVRSVVIDPTATTTLYAGTDRGIFKSTDGGNSWTTTTNRLINASVATIAIDPQNTSTLYAGTDSSPDCFVAKLNPQGSVLLYSSYLGGDTDDFPSGIAVDGLGNIYLAGFTRSAGFPTRNPVQPFGGGVSDGFVAKLDIVHPDLVYSTHLGGGSLDSIRGMAVDVSGNAYVTGFTQSADFPTVAPLQAHLADADGDSFVAKLNPAGSALSFSTYFGGGEGALHSSGLDFGTGITVDSTGSVYVAGSTNSDNFPTTPGVFQFAKRGSSITAFVAKLSEQSPFDTCLQDESSGATLLVNTTNGDYLFFNCRGLTLTGTSSITRRGCLITLQVNGPDRRLLARIDTCMNSGTASVQVLSSGMTFTILDRNTGNNSCTCSR